MSIKCSWSAYEVPMKFLWNIFEVVVKGLWSAYDVAMKSLCSAFVMLSRCLWSAHEVLMKCLWGAYEVLMMPFWSAYEAPMRSLWDIHDRFSFGCVIRILIWLRNGIVPHISFMSFPEKQCWKQKIKTKNVFLCYPFAVWVGGVTSGSPRGLDKFDLVNSHETNINTNTTVKEKQNTKRKNKIHNLFLWNSQGIRSWHGPYWMAKYLCQRRRGRRTAIDYAGSSLCAMA